MAKRRPPAKDLESRENQMISYAVDLAEKQLREGTASAQVISHYLKLGTTTHQLEKEKLREENKLLKARTEQIANMAKMEEMYSAALKAMTSYQGTPTEDDYDDPNI